MRLLARELRLAPAVSRLNTVDVSRNNDVSEEAVELLRGARPNGLRVEPEPRLQRELSEDEAASKIGALYRGKQGRERASALKQLEGGMGS